MKSKATMVFATGLLLFVVFQAMAQNRTKFEYAWAYVSGESTMYVSNRVVEVRTIDVTGGVEEMRRWERALRGNGVDLADLSSRRVGTSGGIDYEGRRNDAEDSRLEFIERERRSGTNVIVVHW